MAVVQVNIPEKLWERLQQTGRPVEELLVEALEKTVEEKLSPNHSEGLRVDDPQDHAHKN